MSDLRESNIGPTSRSFQSPEKEKKEKKIHERKHPKHVFLINKLCRNYFAEMYLMKYLLGFKLINTSERVAYFTKNAGKRR